VTAGSAHGGIGFLGGTFDPPHLGHLWLAALALDSLGLERVTFIPAGVPPHKQSAAVSSATDRLAMTRLAVDGDQGEPRFEVSSMEIERSGPSYTVETATDLLARYPDQRLVLLMAADALAQIDTWREPDRLLEIVEWAVAPRPGSTAADPRRLQDRFGPAADRIHLLDGPGLDLSSTVLRARVAAGDTIRYLVPRDVERYIADHGLYRARG
jgi:nicotinate-nucleotide adenylyltransferase